ncbi:Hsp20/alpha crystallin family protein [bacterium]|nr:Hsp20/alpha crystallin family protein [bacterium]
MDLGIGLGGIFEGIGNLIESVSKMAEQGKGIVEKHGEIKGLGDKVKGVYGFTVRTLAGGESKVEPFGNIKKTPKGPVVEEEREPMVDVFDEKDHILVVAELPGVEEASIKTEIKDDILNISAEKGDRKYKKEVLLPSKVEAGPITSAYKNGILEIKLKKQGK